MPRTQSPSADRVAGGPFVVSRDGSAGLSRDECRSKAFRRPSRSLRIPAVLPDDHEIHCRAVDLVSRADAVLWGPSAALLMGLPLPYRLEGLTVHVLVPEKVPRPRRAGVRARQADIIAAETHEVRGLRLTSPARTFVDLAAFMGLPSLVAVGDAVLRDWRCPPEEIESVIRRRLRYGGKVRARQALPLLDPRSESPQESRLRVHIIEDGLPAPSVNMVIRDELGEFIARVDLGYEKWRIVIEYDGQVHATRERRHKDATRRTLLREHGYYVVEVVADDLLFPERAIGKVRRALRARGAI